MSSALQSLLTDPWFYIGAAVLVWTGRLGLQRWLQSAVDHHFSLRVESHRHQLELVAEEVRFDLQLRLAGISLYLQKQHAAASEIYGAVRVAHGAISSLFGAQRGLTLDDCNAEDLRELLQRSEVLRGKQDELINSWRRDRQAGAEAVKQHLRELSVPRAEGRLQEARNLMYLNEIYFSDATIKAFDEFVGECNKWLSRRYFPPERGEKVEPVSREKLDQTLESVHSALRAELYNPPGRRLPAANTQMGRISETKA